MHVFIEIIISMVGLYIIFSIINSVLVEGYAELFNRRGKFLKKSIDNFFENPVDESIELSDKLYNQRLIKAFKLKGRLPSYIDRKVFSQSLMEMLYSTADDDGVEALGDNLNPDVLEKLPVEVRNSLSFILKKAPLKAEERFAFIQEEIEKLYDSFMERVSSWYKRKLRKILVVAGSVFALVLNLDSISFFNTLKDDGEIRRNYVTLAQALDQNRDSLVIDTVGIKSVLSKQNIDAIGQDLVIDNLINNMFIKDKNVTARFRQSDLNIGLWNFLKGKKNLWDYLLGPIGIVITGVALSYGATFWFDFLRKILRGGG